MILNIRSAITTLQADLTSGFKIWMQQKCPGFCWASAGTWILPMHKHIDRITAYLANIMHNIWVKTIGENRNSRVQVINVHLAPSVRSGGGGSVGTLRWLLAGFAITIFWVRAWPDPLNRLVLVCLCPYTEVKVWAERNWPPYRVIQRLSTHAPVYCRYVPCVHLCMGPTLICSDKLLTNKVLLLPPIAALRQCYHKTSSDHIWHVT